MLPTTFSAIKIDDNARQWLALFRRHWPQYRRWYLTNNRSPLDAASLARAEQKLKLHMPELMPIYRQLKHLTNDDPVAAQFLTLYRPPAYLINCSQAVFLHDEPILIRNYDLSPQLSENTVLHTNWQNTGIVCTSEFLWGADDGINDAGLALSLTFGGRQVVGDGFGIPIILRYILQTCESVNQAAAVLRRVPSHMAYNITVLDKSGDYATINVAPDRDAVVSKDRTATNHQSDTDWPQQEAFNKTRERKAVLDRLVKHPGVAKLTEQNLVDIFHRPPIYSQNYQQNFGTVFTAVYKPQSKPRQSCLSYYWPSGQRWQHSLNNFQQGEKTVVLGLGFARNATSSAGRENHQLHNAPTPSQPPPGIADFLEHIPASSLPNRAAYSRLKQELKTGQSIDWHTFARHMQALWQPA